MSKFAKYTREKPVTTRPDLLDQLQIRPAVTEDLCVIARISAERSGLDPSHHRDSLDETFSLMTDTGKALILVGEIITASNMDSLEADQPGHTPQTSIAGFGKVSYTNPRDKISKSIPEGWYLSGVIVANTWRRHGLGAALTGARLDWISQRAKTAYYLANARNQVTIKLHQKFGFYEVSRDFSSPGVTFEGGEGILFQVDLQVR